MKMKIVSSPAFLGLAIALGTTSLAFFASRFAIPVAIAVLMLLFWDRRQARGGVAILAPLTAGLLVWPMRFFYWDRADFTLRSNLLLLLCLAAVTYRLLVHHPFPLRLADAFARWPLRRRLLVLFLATETLFVAAAGLISLGGVKLVGDEPHYLAIAQSIARDRDLNVFNQYNRGGVREFYPGEKLSAHATFGRGFKTMYSIHLPGLALPLAPFFWISLSPPLLYFLMRVWLGVFGALLGVLLYLFALRLFPESPRLSLGFVLTYLASAPAFFFSIHAFPEVQATLLILAGLYLLLYPGNRPRLNALLGGLLLALPLFWGVKYALLLYLYAPYFLFRFVRGRRWDTALLFLIGPLAVQAMFFAYLHSAYGTFSPSAVYYGLASQERTKAITDTLLDPVTWRLRIETLLDYLLDQRDGLLPYAPVYVFALPGAILSWRRRKKYLGPLLVALPPLLFLLNHAFSTIRAGACPQGRYLLPILWAFLGAAAIFFRETPVAGWRRGFITLAVLGGGITLYQTFSPFTLYQPTTHDVHHGAGLLFQQASNAVISLPPLLPSFLKDLSPWSAADIFWLGFLGLFSWLAIRRWAPGRWFARTVFAAAFFLLALLPRPGLVNPWTVTAPGMPPFRVYHGFLAPRQAPQAPFPLDRQDLPWLVETRAGAGVTVCLENRGDLPVAVGGSSFDTPLPEVIVPARGSVEIPLPPASPRAWLRTRVVQWRPRLENQAQNHPALVLSWRITPD